MFEPNKNKIPVWINKYSESTPKMLGVRMRLFTTVWKSIVANAIAMPVTIIAVTDKARLVKAYCQRFGK